MTFSDPKPNNALLSSSNDGQSVSQQPVTERALAMHIDGVQDSLRYMPDTGYRLFCQQILANDTSSRSRWLRLNTTVQTILLTQKMLDGLVTDDEFDYLLPYIVTINSYFFYENISDHLSIGLAYHRPNDKTYQIRHQVVYAFNDTISRRIRDYLHDTAQELLTSIQPLIAQISVFDQSLNRAEFQRIANTFLQTNGTGISHREIEFSAFSSLIANIETCLAALNVLREYETFPLIQDSVARRYEAMNRLMEDAALTIDELVTLGTDTVLVEFAIGYYIAIIAEQLRPMGAYSSILEDGSLAEGLRDAALLVRLLDDLGTRILEDPQERQMFINIVRNTQNQQKHTNFYDLLLDVVEKDNVALTRLKKDLVFGESNVLLYASLREDNLTQAVDLLETHLQTLAETYHERKQNLNRVVKHISIVTGGAIIGEMILRFVKFHERMYGESFEKGSEYAI